MPIGTIMLRFRTETENLLLPSACRQILPRVLDMQVEASMATLKPYGARQMITLQGPQASFTAAATHPNCPVLRISQANVQVEATGTTRKGEPISPNMFHRPKVLVLRNSVAQTHLCPIPIRLPALTDLQKLQREATG
mmetsp:Transcript_33979/g.54666  ORF Transcript_33979/g.54666 Transcript_33979/m.54666 type:complete len:138 (-) Transcript_33979:391-804(-)